jgi:hypothetical protein
MGTMEMAMNTGTISRISRIFSIYYAIDVGAAVIDGRSFAPLKKEFRR